MKKRLLSLLLAVCTALSLLAVPAGAAASRYTDVADQNTATMAEVLRLMGVMDGYADGAFRPDAQLNRAQFCKMATYAMNQQQKLGLYRTVTVFPDVKPSHWAAAYINLAARTSAGGGQAGGSASGEGSTASVARPIIAGYPDGKFHPERVVTMGQAVTILLRVLGYQDTEIGGVWPDSYMATGAVVGLTKGLSANGNAPLTRGQAARLFVNLLEAKTSAGGTLYTLSEEVELSGVDGGAGVMKTLDGKVYQMANPVSETTLAGSRGRVVLKDNVALTFLPEYGEGTGSAAGAIVVNEDQSSAGLNALAGNSNYRIYKNGTPATAADLRKYDVATYYPATNSIIVCDTRLTVYYESCEPNPKAPTKIQVLGGTELYVLPTAMDSLSQFRPGDKITLLMTADGRVASAVKAGDTRGNAVAVVSQDGQVQLLCGNGTIEVQAKADKQFLGEVVRLSSTQKDRVEMTVLSGGKSGTLDVPGKMLGRNHLAEGVMIFENGKQISLNQITSSEIPDKQIRYSRTNWAGEVDLIVLDRATDEIYGRVFWEVTRPNEEHPNSEIVEKLGVEYGNGQRTETFEMGYNVQTGDYVAAKLNRGGTGFSQMIKLDAVKGVSKNSWIGKTSVTAGGKTYEVPADVLCYNADSQEWTTLDKAFAYSDTMDIFVRNGVVRVIEVR